MSFREKSALIHVILFLAIFAYLSKPGFVIFQSNGGEVYPVKFLIIGVLVIVGVEIISHAIIALLSPNEANAPADERERMIELKASRNAHWALALAGGFAICLAPLFDYYFVSIYAIFMALLVSEIVHYGSELVYFRRGA